MLRCTHLHDRYGKSDLFPSDFISLLSCFRGNDKYQKNRVNSTTWNPLPNNFSVNYIQDGPFRGCSRMERQKGPHPLNLSHTCYNDEFWQGHTLTKEDLKNI